MKVVEHGVLIQLPNKDLWRGFDPTRKRADNVDATATPSAEAKVEGSECLWCGMKFDSNDLLKEHVEHLHFLQKNLKDVAREFLTTSQMPGAPVTLGAELKETK